MANSTRGLYIFCFVATVATTVYNVISAIQVFTQASMGQIFIDVRYRVLFLTLMFGFMAWWIVEKEYNEYTWRHSKPIIKLRDLGFEIKEWQNSPPSVVAFIEVFNEPREDVQSDVNANKVYPTVVWEDFDGREVDRNPGR